MWQIKKFKTQQAMAEWLAKRDGKIQFVEVFVENGWAVEWRKLRRIG